MMRAPSQSPVVEMTNRCPMSFARRSAVTFFVVLLFAFGTTAPAFADPVDVTTTSTTLTPTSDSSPGFFDVSGRVRQAIDEWFTSLVTSTINPALDLLGRTLLSAPDLTTHSEVHVIWTISLVTADTIFVVFAIIGGIVVMTHETIQVRYSAKEIIPRLVFAVIAVNISLVIISQAIALANGLAQAFLGNGLDSSQAVGGLGGVIVATTGQGGLYILMALAVTVLCLMLVGVYLVRALLIVLLIVAAPLALACHALPQTEHIAMLWWRSVAACLTIQVAQALVLLTAVRVFFAPDGSTTLGLGPAGALLNLLITLCLFWIMWKIPTWAERVVFGPNSGPTQAVQRTMKVALTTAVKAAA